MKETRRGAHTGREIHLDGVSAAKYRKTELTVEGRRRYKNEHGSFAANTKSES